MRWIYGQGAGGSGGDAAVTELPKDPNILDVLTVLDNSGPEAVEGKVVELIGQADLPEHARQYGSPTILVQGKDVAGGEAPGADACCRIYADGGGVMRGVPTVEQIAAKLRLHSSASGRWRLNIAVLSSVGVALLPKLTCPACWPAYAGLLSAMGLGVLATGTWLLPLTLGFLGIALGALAFRARQRRGFGPLLVVPSAGLEQQFRHGNVEGGLEDRLATLEDEGAPLEEHDPERPVEAGSTSSAPSAGPPTHRPRPRAGSSRRPREGPDPPGHGRSRIGCHSRPPS